MAEKQSFPQIPSTVWWGVRALLQRSPNSPISERTLGVQLNVQEAAAKQYVVELRRAGILDEDGKATELGQRWRHDDTYADAVSDILSQTYPESLIQIAPPGEADRQKVISWFTREGLGRGTAGNKAATYLLISSAEPNASTPKSAGAGTGAQRKPSSKASTGDVPKKTVSENARREAKVRAPSPDQMPLNVNVQIHIGADASSDQIESIFSAMRRYLYDGTAT
ncbi:hypothetical protein ACO2Q1_14770 [Brevundimonas sp. VNH65]|uniref:hypothetical protein n=1 Tax=Brevundimonas sp. VNH65 TaxID=3400917 RepID=UPI003C024D89